MNKEPHNVNAEEIDLGQLFKLIGSTFDRFYNFIGSIFKSIFSVIILTLKAIIKNFKIIALSMLIAGILGYTMDRYKSRVYFSTMLVKPYFDSKYQLVTNINYYNALIADKDFKQLSSIFKIEEEEVKEVISFEVTPGPETENDRILEYESFIKKIDSTRALDISFDKFIEERSIYSGSFFEISVKSHKKDIFRLLEKGLNSTFINKYSTKKKKKRDSLIGIEKLRLLKSIKEIDSLKTVYIKVLQDESNNSDKGNVTLKDGMSLVQERVKTKEYELLNKQLELRQALTELEAEKIQEDVFFDTISSFQDVGSEYSVIWGKSKIIFPLITLILLIFGYLIKKLVIFTNKYDG